MFLRLHIRFLGLSITTKPSETVTCSKKGTGKKQLFERIFLYFWLSRSAAAWYTALYMTTLFSQKSFGIISAKYCKRCYWWEENVKNLEATSHTVIKNFFSQFVKKRSVVWIKNSEVKSLSLNLRTGRKTSWPLQLGLQSPLPGSWSQYVTLELAVETLHITYFHVEKNPSTQKKKLESF